MPTPDARPLTPILHLDRDRASHKLRGQLGERQLLVGHSDSAPARLHHIGLLSADLDRTVPRLATAFDLTVDSPVIEDRAQEAKVQFLRGAAARHWIEIIAPLTADSHLHNALSKGVSLHHQCYEVQDLPQSLAKLRRLGWMPVGSPKPGAAFDGRSIAWLIDEANLLVELVQAGDGPRSLAELDRQARETVDG